MSTPAPKAPFNEYDAHVTVEVLNGVKLMSPRPALPHALVANLLSSELTHRFHRKSGGPPERPGGWIILFEPELHLDDNIVVPDLAGWRRERWPLIPRDNAAATRVAPDWVCEVLSDSTAKSDRQRKMPIYHQYGVGHLWLVDPLLQTVEVFRHSDTGYLFLTNYCDQDHLRAEPFAAIEIQLEEIWPELEPLT